MKKDNTKYVGIDIGDKTSLVRIIDSDGDFLKEVRVRTTRKALAEEFSKTAPMEIALEVGSHSRWISQDLEKYGHNVTVANPSKVRLVYKNPRKSDRIDAHYLAKLLRFEPELLEPIKHRGNTSQKDLALLRSRDGLVRARTSLVNQARGIVKSFGNRLPSCNTDAFAKKVRDDIPEDLKSALYPVLDTIQSLTDQIKAFDKEIERLCKEDYPETERMRQIKGVGPLTSLAYVLTIEDPKPFLKSREVGAYLGMVPKRSQSGDVDPEKRITKTGDKYLRRMLIGSAQYILGPFGTESRLRNWGLHLAERGGQRAKNKATVAVARKLAVLLHKLWVSGEDYHPFYPERGAVEADTE